MNRALRLYRRLGVERIEDRVMLSAAPPPALDFLLPDFHLAASMPDLHGERLAHVADGAAAGKWGIQDWPAPYLAIGSPLRTVLHGETVENSPTLLLRVRPETDVSRVDFLADPPFSGSEDVAADNFLPTGRLELGETRSELRRLDEPGLFRVTFAAAERSFLEPTAGWEPVVERFGQEFFYRGSRAGGLRDAFPAAPANPGLPALGVSAVDLVIGGLSRIDDHQVASVPGTGIDIASAAFDLPLGSSSPLPSAVAGSIVQSADWDSLARPALSAARVPGGDGGFIGIDQPFLRSRVLASSASNSNSPLVVNGTLSGVNADSSANHWTPPRVVATPPEDASDSPAAVPAPTAENGDTSQEPADSLAQEEPAGADLLSVDPDENRPSGSDLTAISLADPVAGESEGGLIDLTDLSGETAPLEGQAAAGSLVASAEVPSEDEHWMVDGSRGRFQVFELALAAGSLPDPDDVLPVSDSMPPETPEVHLTSLRPGAEHGATYRSRASDEVFAQLADEPHQRQTSAGDDIRWSISRILLFGGAVIGYRAAERNAQTGMIADSQPVPVARAGRIG